MPSPSRKLQSPFAHALTDSGEEGVFFTPEKVEASLLPFRYALVAKMPYSRPPYPEIKTLFAKQLGLSKEFVIATLDPQHLLLRCTSEDDYLRLLLRVQIPINPNQKEPCSTSLNGCTPLSRPVILPVWVEFLTLKANLFHEACVHSIAGNLGRVLQVALRTTKITNAMVAYAYVELNVLQDWPSRI